MLQGEGGQALVLRVLSWALHILPSHRAKLGSLPPSTLRSQPFVTSGFVHVDVPPTLETHYSLKQTPPFLSVIQSLVWAHFPRINAAILLIPWLQKL